MRDVVINNPKNDRIFFEQFASLYLTLKGLSNNEQVNFDFCKLNFAYPLLVLPLAAYISNTKSEFKNIGACNAGTYLKTINFPFGIGSISEFNKFTSGGKSYTPISRLLKDNPADRDRLISLFLDLIMRIIGPTAGAKNAIGESIFELSNNIFEHGRVDCGYIFGQYYSADGFLDICIVDTGRGFKQAYKDECNFDFSDEEAIREVMKGNSTKQDKERGYGVRTSKKIVCDCMKGKFMMVSGAAALYSDEQSNKIIALPGFYWQGVIISFRIPKPNGPVDITSYLE